MDTTNDSAMVALLPMTADWSKTDLPHMTLVYLGKVVDLEPALFTELSKIASSLSILSNPIHVKVSGVERFGEDEPVDVLRVIPTSELTALRSFLEDWDNGEFPDYKPHVTIGPAGGFHQDLPIMMSFDRILVMWGSERLTFWLRRY